MSEPVSFKLKNDMNTLSGLGMLPAEVGGEIVENLNPEFRLRPYQKDAFKRFQFYNYVADASRERSRKKST